jgi:beta-lactam-binding protein with PASTA domain
MPNLTGQPLGSAMLALQDAGVKVGRVSVLRPPLPDEPQAVPVAPSAVSEASAASMIVTQAPAPGQKITAGSAVNFEVR